MTIAAVVPVWNGRELLGRMLESLTRQTHQTTALIVADNGSTDGAPELARAYGARVIAMGRNAGFAAAVNRGIRECAVLKPKPDAIAVLNSDVELAPDYLEKLAGADAWFATGKLLTPRSDRIDGTFDAICRGGAAWRVGSGRKDGPMFSERRAMALTPLTAALFRREIFERVGLLDERFESYLEDVDFGLRCAAHGIEGVFEPAAVAWHQGSATLGRWHPETVRRIARNQVFLLARHYPASLLRRWMRPILAAHLLWGGVAVRHGTGFAWLRGLTQGIASFSAMRKQETLMPEKVMESLLSSHERTIYQFQASTEYDAYWRWYFRLAGREA
jgi:GT2 family glycosyltransferase